MENPKSLLLLADTFCNRAEKSKIHSFSSYRTKKQGKIHMYMYFKRGQIIFLGKRSYLIIFPIQKSAHYKIALHHYIHLETCSVLLLAGGRGDSCVNFPRSCKLPICLIIFPSTDSFPLEYQ